MESIHNTAVSLHLLCYICFDFNRELLQCLCVAPSFVPCLPWSGTPSSISIPASKVCRWFVPVLALFLAELWLLVSSHLSLSHSVQCGGEWIHDGGRTSGPWRYQVSSQYLNGLWNREQGKSWSRKDPRGILSSLAVWSRIFWVFFTSKTSAMILTVSTDSHSGSLTP